MSVTIEIAWTENKASTELEGVLTHPLLPVARGSRPLPGCGVVAAEYVEQRGVSKARNAIRFPILINQQRKGDARVLAERPSVLPVAKANGGKTRPLGLERSLMLAQLRDMLATEYSTVVAEEDEDGRAIGPKGAEPNRVAVAVGEDDRCEFPAE